MWVGDLNKYLRKYDEKCGLRKIGFIGISIMFWLETVQRRSWSQKRRYSTLITACRVSDNTRRAPLSLCPIFLTRVTWARNKTWSSTRDTVVLKGVQDLVSRVSSPECIARPIYLLTWSYKNIFRDLTVFPGSRWSRGTRKSFTESEALSAGESWRLKGGLR